MRFPNLHCISIVSNNFDAKIEKINLKNIHICMFFVYLHHEAGRKIRSYTAIVD